jgi:hypothetical protein
MSQNYISTQEMDGLMVRISKSDLKVLDMITIKPPFFLGFHRFHHLFFGNPQDAGADLFL